MPRLRVRHRYFRRPHPLRRQRRLAGLTQRQLARKSGVPAKRIEVIEAGYDSMTRREVWLLSGALACDCIDILPMPGVNSDAPC
jgi:transcriptional regulator with XRE-family HTH domain